MFIFLIYDIDSNLANSANFKWAIGKNAYGCKSGLVNSGDFRNIQNDKIILLDDVEYSTAEDTYYLYIWLDEAETNSNTMNQSFDFSIGSMCENNGYEKAYLKMNWPSITNAEIDYKTQITDIYFTYDEDLPNGIQSNNEGTFDFTIGTYTYAQLPSSFNNLATIITLNEANRTWFANKGINNVIIKLASEL